MCLDGYMNIALEQAEEWIEGIRHRTYGDAFIRGNNGKAPSLHFGASDYFPSFVHSSPLTNDRAIK